MQSLEEKTNIKGVIYAELRRKNKVYNEKVWNKC